MQSDRFQNRARWTKMAGRKNKFKRKNLVFLTIDRGKVELNRKPPDGVIVDSKKGTWKLKNGNEEYRIGLDERTVYPKYLRSGVIGVYNASKIQHLRLLLHTAILATRNDTCDD